MILDVISNASFYHSLGGGIAKGLRFLESADWAGLEAGRHEIDGEDVYAILSCHENTLPEKETFEAHRRYIDIQFVALGEERMRAAPLGSLDAVTEYDAEKDCQFLEGYGDVITVRQGMFALFAPQDAHMPGLPGSQGGVVKKAVVKVRI